MMTGVRSWVAGLAAVAGCALALGCAHTAAPPPAAAPPAADKGGANGDVYVSTDVGPPEIIALWASYGVALATAADRLGHDDFAAELEARTFLADSWKKGRASSSASDPYLDTLAAVRDAGFMSEYVLAFLTREGWTVSGSDLAKLDIAGFTAWAAAHLPRLHEAVTRVKVVLKAPTRPTVVPGLDLVHRERLTRNTRTVPISDRSSIARPPIGSGRRTRSPQSRCRSPRARRSCRRSRSSPPTPAPAARASSSSPRLSSR